MNKKLSIISTILIISLIAVFSGSPVLAANTHSATFVAGSSQGKETTADFTDYGTDEVTVEVWVKTSTDNPTSMVVGVNNAVSATFQLVKISGSGYRFEIGLVDVGAEISDYIAEGDVEDGTWHHLAGVYDGANMHIYLDGSEQGTENPESGNIITTNPSHLSIATRAETPDLFWDGQIDDVRVWNDARTASEIKDNLDAELVGNETGLTFYAKLNNDNTEETGNYTISDINSPTFTTDFPFDTTNTHSIDLEEDSTQFLSITDANQTGLDLASDVTFEIWAKWESVGDSKLNSKFVSAGGRAYTFDYYHTGTQLRLGVSSDCNVSPFLAVTWTASVNTWYHLAVAYDLSAGEADFYVDGSQQGTTQSGGTTSLCDSI